LPGEAVTDTVRPVGMRDVCSSAFLSGISSNVGSERTRASAALSVPASRALALPLPRATEATTWRTRSDVGVGEGGFPLGDVLVERLVDAWVDRGRLVLGEHPLPDLVGALRRLERTILEPLLERVVVGGRGAVEGRLEVGEGVRVAEEVNARAVLADRVERLAVLGQVDALHEHAGHPALVEIDRKSTRL